MKVTVDIELDDTWNDYFVEQYKGSKKMWLNVKPELFLEDLFSTWTKDGIIKTEVKAIERC